MHLKQKSLTVRLDDELLCKIRYVASYEGWSMNQQIIQWARKHIYQFEKQVELIKIDCQ